ncbi:response regulator transcription factor [Paenibacillus turpanensis]|uniref:response regulator transcription factor n=1 Tax=Paenibacillus turpanensis TaxID=2689078 RepID=UPI0014088695|nr:response regulator transcription factor [Paenibacillus turpanensis]
MDTIRILIADDEKEIRDLLKKYLERERYEVDTAIHGEEALRLFAHKAYQLVILDVMMPKIDGMEACRSLRKTSNVPIMMLTAKDDEVDKIVGLTVGADDYITKPFSINEVVARVKALLRRSLVLNPDSRASEEERFHLHGVTLDMRSCTASVDGREIALTAKELQLLKFFMQHPGQVFTKTQLFRQVWNSDYLEDDNTVMVHIRKLRKKIEADPSDPQYIQTVWGIGYKFAGERE